jgi:hypothetical protein
MNKETLMNDLELLGVTYDEFMETYENAMVNDAQEEISEDGTIITEEHTSKLTGIEMITYYLVIDGVKEYVGETEASNVPKRFEILGQINEYKRNNNLN